MSGDDERAARFAPLGALGALASRGGAEAVRSAAHTAGGLPGGLQNG